MTSLRRAELALRAAPAAHDKEGAAVASSRMDMVRDSTKRDPTPHQPERGNQVSSFCLGEITGGLTALIFVAFGWWVGGR